MQNTADVSTPSPAVAEDEAKRQLVRCIQGGTDAMRAGGEQWLPRHPAESVGVYKTRLQKTFLDNFVGLAIEKSTGKLFSKPVKTENIAEHTMHSEWYEVPEATQQAIAACKARGGRVVAVGTTTVRTLESWAKFGQASGDTQIFITPGFEFQVVDRLITNFHLPKSTLMMLVSAFAGYEHIMGLYRHAIAQQYRFFSYGDAMLLSRVPPG